MSEVNESREEGVEEVSVELITEETSRARNPSNEGGENSRRSFLIKIAYFFAAFLFGGFVNSRVEALLNPYNLSEDEKRGLTEVLKGNMEKMKILYQYYAGTYKRVIKLFKDNENQLGFSLNENFNTPQKMFTRVLASYYYNAIVNKYSASNIGELFWNNTGKNFLGNIFDLSFTGIVARSNLDAIYEHQEYSKDIQSLLPYLDVQEGKIKYLKDVESLVMSLYFVSVGARYEKTGDKDDILRRIKEELIKIKRDFSGNEIVQGSKQIQDFFEDNNFVFNNEELATEPESDSNRLKDFWEQINAIEYIQAEDHKVDKNNNEKNKTTVKIFEKLFAGELARIVPDNIKEGKNDMQVARLAIYWAFYKGGVTGLSELFLIDYTDMNFKDLGVYIKTLNDPISYGDVNSN